MNKIITSIGTLLLLAAFSFQANAAELGYTTGELARTNVFRVGSSTKQGLAIKIGKEKLAVLKGKSISAISTAFGTRNTKSQVADLFITSSLNGSPLASKQITITAAAAWLETTLDKPYIITGDEENLYIGYTVDATNTTLKPLMADFDGETQDCCYAYNDGEWIDINGLEKGGASIKVTIDDCPDFADAILRPLDLNGYFKAGQSYSRSGVMFNFGTETIKSFNINVKVGDAAPFTIEKTGVEIKQNEIYSFELPEFSASASGKLPISIEIDNVNGNKDAAPDDNNFSATACFYPEGMERNFLLEGFTGQACSNCPAGHRILNDFINSCEPSEIVEVMHHAGYYPDIFTMAYDTQYTRLYNSNSTFAPAVMLNRTTFMQLSQTRPVMDISTNPATLLNAYEILKATQPYVSLNLESTFDKTTREVTVKLTTMNHNDLLSTNNVLNVMLIQDGIVASQTGGGNNYVHNAVFRGTLTGNAWGKKINKAAGDVNNWEYSFTLPEKIFSDYYNPSAADADQYNLPAIPEDISIVAYVSALGAQNVNEYYVYNCVKVKLGESHKQGGMSDVVTGIKDIAVDTNKVNIFAAEGRIVVDGDCESVEIFDMSGKKVSANTRLGNGIYIVRAISNGKTAVKKVMIK